MATRQSPPFLVPATGTETRRNSLRNEKQQLPPLFPEEITVYNVWKYINYYNLAFLNVPPLIALYGLLTTEIQRKTVIWSVLYYHLAFLSLTAGYHRLWSHRAYVAAPLLCNVFAFFGAGVLRGSILEFATDHRIHHRWSDTEKDPVSSHRGFFFTHIGWLIVKRPGWKRGHADVDDLLKNEIIQWQHKNYRVLSLISGIVVPAIVPTLWGDLRGGFFYAVVLRLVILHQAIYCVNSLAHWLGESAFDDKQSSRDHFVTSVITMGEGYHNFHHQFPQDYRGSFKFYQWDPIKWLINICFVFGLASHLKTFPNNEIEKASLQMVEKKAVEKQTKLTWGIPISQLPVIDYQDFQNACKNEDKKWILLEGVVYDVTDFIPDHPGGRKCLELGIGKDMTTAFNGGIYDHSNAARNLLGLMRVAVVKYGGEVEAEKRYPSVPVYKTFIS